MTEDDLLTDAFDDLSACGAGGYAAFELIKASFIRLRAENAILSEEVARLKAERDESARYACEQLLDMYWLYPNYRVDTRGPVGKIRNVTSRLWPVLDEVIGNAGFDEARKAFFPTDENVEPLPESPK